MTDETGPEPHSQTREDAERIFAATCVIYAEDFRITTLGDIYVPDTNPAPKRTAA